MNLKHVGLVCSSEGNADRFFSELLGLNKEEPKILPADLSDAIFNIDSDLTVINYKNGNTHFEVFITDLANNPSRQIGHACFEVDDRDAFVDRCRKSKVEIIQVPKGDKILLFISDDDNNLFEIVSST